MRAKAEMFGGQTAEQRAFGERYARKQAALRRAHCDMMQFWRVCGRPVCRRNRTCSGDAQACFTRHWGMMPEEDKEYLRGGIIAKRSGAAGDEIIRGAAARREEYLKSIESNSVPAASPRRADDSQAAPPANVRIRRL